MRRAACRNCEGGTPRGVATMLIAFARVRYVANGSDSENLTVSTKQSPLLQAADIRGARSQKCGQTDNT
jgi:hypothetical protein